MARAAVGSSIVGVRALGAPGHGVYRYLTGQSDLELAQSS